MDERVGALERVGPGLGLVGLQQVVVADVEDPRPYIDLVKDDEFPLSMFYSSLKGKLAVAA